MKIEEAVVTIQKVLRGHCVRRRLLSKAEKKEAIQLICTTENLNSLPRAPHGANPVYIPAELSLVLKVLGIERAKRRFFANWHARELCDTQHFKHLVVPRFTLYEGFTIEEKLPVSQTTLRSQTSFYLSNLSKFSEPAKEFTSFLLHTHFPDILTTSHPYYSSSYLPLGRSDNIPFFMKNEEVKIALIDLGGHRVREHPSDEEDIKKCVETAVAIFPYHASEICAVAGVCRSAFEELSEKTKTLFQIICLGEEVIRQKANCRELLERQLAFQLNQKEILYYNFYTSRENQLMVIIHR